MRQLDSVHGTPGSQCSDVLADVFNGQATMSTTFSGIDAPGQALHGLCCSLRKEFDFEEPLHVPCLAACEWNEESRKELNLHPCKPECMFIDICEFINVKIRKRVLDGAATGRFSYGGIKKVLLDKGAVTDMASCVQRSCRRKNRNSVAFGVPKFILLVPPVLTIVVTLGRRSKAAVDPLWSHISLGAVCVSRSRT